MPNGTQLASDNFVRGSYPTNLGGGDGWTAISGLGALTIASAGVLHVSAINTACGAIWTGLVWPPDQYSEITLGVVPNASSDTSAYVRMDASQQNGYRMDVHLTVATVYVFVSGTPTPIINKTGLTVNAGDVFRLTIIGTTIVVTQNDRTIAFISDATVASGSAGVLMYNQLSTTTSSMASWRGGIPSGNTNGIWTKQGVVIPANAADIVAGAGIPGASNASILYEGNAQLLSGIVFKAWFQGKTDIFYAESTNGQAWTRKVAAVIAARGIPKIFKNGSTYYCHVTHTAGGPWTQIDQYTSSDGVNFTLAHANILSVGGVGTWDSAFCGYFQVVAIIAGTWYAMYDGNNNVTGGFGLATSPDGVTWTKYASNPVLGSGIGAIDQAIKFGSIYYAWLTEATLGQTGGGNAIITRYHTTDFITWIREATSLQPDSVDEGRNYAPGQISVASTVEANGSTYCFYSASPDDAGAGCYQIRMASAPYTVAQIIQNQEYFVQFKQTATDDFQRANGSLGANWTTSPSNSALQIASHKAEPSAVNTNCAAYYSAAAAPNDQYCEITIATLTDSNSFTLPGARQSASTSDHYGPSFSGGAGSVVPLGLYKVVGGVVTQLGSNTTLTPNVSDKIRVSTVGTDISFFQNEHLLLQETDSSIASGFPVIGLFNVTAIANSQVSLFAGGSANGPLPSFPAGSGDIGFGSDFLF